MGLLIVACCRWVLICWLFAVRLFGGLASYVGDIVVVWLLLGRLTGLVVLLLLLVGLLAGFG